MRANNPSLFWANMPRNELEGHDASPTDVRLMSRRKSRERRKDERAVRDSVVTLEHSVERGPSSTLDLYRLLLPSLLRSPRAYPNTWALGHEHHVYLGIYLVHGLHYVSVCSLLNVMERILFISLLLEAWFLTPRHARKANVWISWSRYWIGDRGE